MTVAEQVLTIFAGVRGYLDDVDLKNIEDFENQLLEKCKSEKPEIIESISSTGKLDETIEKKLATLINELKEKFKNA